MKDWRKIVATLVKIYYIHTLINVRLSGHVAMIYHCPIAEPKLGMEIYIKLILTVKHF